MPVITRSQRKKIAASSAVIIDNCVVSRIPEEGIYGVRIRHIELEKKLNPTLEIDSLPKITYGSRGKDNKLIILLAKGLLSFEDVIMQNL